MTGSDALYVELKPEVERLASALFGASERFVRNRGAFLPHGATLTSDGQVHLCMAVPDTDEPASTPAECLPLLHSGLLKAAQDDTVVAVGVSEDVTITPQGSPETRAIKVLFEHRRGLCVALYVPYKRRLLGGYNMGDMMALPATPEVDAWSVGSS